MKVLILASNPRKDLSIDREIRDLREVIEKSHNHHQFEVSDALAVRVADLQQLLFKYEPQIVHFCGHGSGQQGLVFQDDNEKEQWVQAEALSELFRLFSNSVECVLLNACYSEAQANHIVNHINYVIGMKQEIQDNAAIAFSKGFYQALGYNRSIEQAFEFGRNAIQLEISGSSRVRSLETNKNRKIQVVDAIEHTPIPEHIKPILKVKSTLPVNTEGNRRLADQAIPEELRTVIQLAIDESLRRDIGVQNFSSQGDSLTAQTSPFSQETDGEGNRKSASHKHAFPSLSWIFAILGITGFVLIGLWAIARITPANDTESQPNPVIESPAREDPVSVNGLNYKQLQQFLETQNWRRADEQTMNRLLQLANRARSRDTNQDWIDAEDVDSLFCDDLSIINRLWSESTNNRLSFTTQAQIWKSVGGTTDTKNVAIETRDRFSRAVGWQDAAYNRVNLNLIHQNIADKSLEEILEGHLPSAIGQFQGNILVGNGNEFAALTSKLQQCGILED